MVWRNWLANMWAQFKTCTAPQDPLLVTVTLLIFSAVRHSWNNAVLISSIMSDKSVGIEVVCTNKAHKELIQLHCTGTSIFEDNNDRCPGSHGTEPVTEYPLRRLFRKRSLEVQAAQSWQTFITFPPSCLQTFSRFQNYCHHPSLCFGSQER